MRLITVIFSLIALCGSLMAQSGLQPEFDISPSIAKLPERSDFYGDWTRGDGGYRLEVEASGEAESGVVARYFNPDPINVESANFEETDEGLRLVIVLRDEGYPGSSYQLEYFAERMVLLGAYARPGGQPSEVYFVRTPKGKDSTKGE